MLWRRGDDRTGLTDEYANVSITRGRAANHLTVLLMYATIGKLLTELREKRGVRPRTDGLR